MANLPISQLPVTTALDPSDVFAVVNDGTTKQVTLQSLSNIVLSTGSGVIGAAENGLSVVNDKVRLGGTLIVDTEIDQLDKELRFKNGTIISESDDSAGSYPTLSNSTPAKFIWNPTKASLRAGYANGGQWDDANVGLRSTALGYNTIASGTASFAQGDSTQATGNQSVALGYQSIASGVNSLAAGFATQAIGQHSVAFGRVTEATGYISFAHGNNSDATGTYSAAFGSQSLASGYTSLAFGETAKAQSTYSLAFGKNAEANNYGSISFGDGTQATKEYSFAFGGNSVAQGFGSMAFGFGVQASQSYSLAFGRDSQATGYSSLSIGQNNMSSQTHAITIGAESEGEGYSALALGFNCYAGGPYALSIGKNNNVTNSGSYSYAARPEGLALGFDLQSDFGAIVIGHQSQGAGANAVTLGSFSNASASLAVSIGTDNHSSGIGALAFGESILAQGDRSMAIGFEVQSQAPDSFVIGRGVNDIGVPDPDDYLKNNIENSLMIGFGSNIPTMFVGPSSGTGTTGAVGIATTSPAAKLHINGDLMLEAGVAVNEIATTVNTSSPSDTKLVTEKAVSDLLSSGGSSSGINQTMVLNGTTLELTDDAGTLTTDLSSLGGGSVTLPTTTKGDLLVHDGTTDVRLPIGADGQVLQADSTTTEGVKWVDQSSSSNPRMSYQFALGGQAISTIGLLAKALQTNSNPGLYPTTSGINVGITGGQIDPYSISSNQKIRTLTLTVAHLAVGTGTVGSNVKLTLELFKNEYNTRTLLQTFEFDVDETKVGMFNNLSIDSFQTTQLTALNVQLNAGDLIGFQFKNVNGNDDINSAAGIYMSMETELD